MPRSFANEFRAITMYRKRQPRFKMTASATPATDKQCESEPGNLTQVSASYPAPAFNCDQAPVTAGQPVADKQREKARHHGAS